MVDSDALVSALITPQGNPPRLWQAVVGQWFQIAVSLRLLAERARAIRNKTARRPSLDQVHDIKVLLKPLGRVARHPEGNEPPLAFRPGYSQPRSSFPRHYPEHSKRRVQYQF